MDQRRTETYTLVEGLKRLEKALDPSKRTLEEVRDEWQEGIKNRVHTLTTIRRIEKMTDLGQRIKMIRENVDMDRHTFAAYIKVAGGAGLIEQWENNEKKPDENALEQIAVLGQTSPVTLACGREINPYVIARLFEYLEIQEEMFYAHERSVKSLYSGWLGGQVHVLEKIREWNDE